MPYYHVPAPSRRGVAWSAIGLIAAVSVMAAFAAGWSASHPLTVTVDGRTVRTTAGTTVGVLQERGVFAASPGDLLGVTGSIVETDGGMPPRVERNGRYAGVHQRVYDGDVLVSARGSNVTESIIVTETTIPFETRFEGDGPITELKQLGAPGVRRVTRGARSGLEVTSTVVAEPLPTIFVRTQPKPGTKLVALTFDDGPQRGTTDRILDILDRHDAQATFFVVGSQVRAQPGLVRRMVAEGHQVANHSYGHRNLRSLDRKQVRSEVMRGRAAIRRAGGGTANWFRPPYGAVDRAAWGELEHLDQRVVLWDVDPRDWERPGTARIVRSVVSSAKPGSIILLHDGGVDRRQTVAALPAIIKQLRAKGFVLVTVEDLAAAK